MLIEIWLSVIEIFQIIPQMSFKTTREKIQTGKSENFNNNSINLADSEEEYQIIQRINESGDASKFVECLISEVKTSVVEEENCKCMLVAIKHHTLEDSVILKLVPYIIARFADGRTEIREMAAFLATALFGKDDFGVQDLPMFNKLKQFIKPGVFKHRQKWAAKYEGFSEIKNEHVEISQNDYTFSNQNVFDDQLNPIHLQKALRIFQEGKDIKALIATHLSFGSILERSSSRVFRIHSDALFNQLIDLSHRELYDLQFKNFAKLLEKNTELIDRAIDHFKSTDSDILRTFILYSFNHLHDILGFDMKINLHLKFAETVLNFDLNLGQVSKSVMTAFVERGMKLLNEEDTIASM